MQIIMKILRAWRLILLIFLVLAIAAGAVWGVKKMKSRIAAENGPTKTRQVLVSIRDNKMPDPVEDKKSSIKLGYVLGVYPEDHKWSDTEKRTFLILKMNLNDKQASELTAPLEQPIKNMTDEQKKAAASDPQAGKETVSAREYKIDFDKIGFKPDGSLLKEQPLLDKTFGWEIVEKND